jgi:sirohydrochlorin cobaltochelatase
VNAAFLELAAPDLDTAVDALVADGVRRITVLPYFLHEGRHTTVDLPALAEAARLRHPMVTVKISPAFGSHPQVTEVLASLIASPASSPATSLRVTSLRAISPASTSPTQE